MDTKNRVYEFKTQMHFESANNGIAVLEMRFTSGPESVIKPKRANWANWAHLRLNRPQLLVHHDHRLDHLHGLHIGISNQTKKR